MAGVAGSAGDSDQLIMAGYFLEEALRNYESSKDWKYLITSVDITTVVGTSIYELPADFRKVYSVRFSTGSPRVLDYMDKRDYDRLRPEQSGTSVPIGYLLNHQWATTGTGTPPAGTYGQIELIPANALAANLVVNYYRKITIPDAIVAGTTASDSSTIDIPQFYQGFLLAWARSLYLANKGGEDERMIYWTKLAQDGLLKARAADEWVPDDSPGFIPGSNRVNTGWNPNNTLPYSSDY